METYLVGGAVRDMLLNKECNDQDYVVVGSTIDEMLSKGYKQVGAEFPVFLHPETQDEYALARKERKTGDKHTDFEFVFTPNITLEEDLIRRDFTMNAIAWDRDKDRFFDYFNGQEDIFFKKVRHIKAEYFVEDPLRVLRAARFCTQLNFDLADETLVLCQEMVAKGMLQHLTPERVWKEVYKALQTPNFAKFIEILDSMNALEIIMPEVYALKTVPENLVYHPEGTTYKHILLTLEHVKILLLNETLSLEDLALINFGLLCHDVGKALTPKDILPSHHGHETAGLEIVQSLSQRFNPPNNFKFFAQLACKHHMGFYRFLDRKLSSKYDLIKQITKFKDFSAMYLLLLVHECDLNGRAGEIASDRIDTCQQVKLDIKLIYSILQNKNLNNLTQESRDHLNKFSGAKFGELYRCEMLDYLKEQLRMVKA